MRGAPVPILLILFAVSCVGGEPRGGGEGERVARFAYVLNEADETVTVHAVESTGRLRFRSFVRTRPYPRAIASDPTGSWVFVGTASTPVLSPPPYYAPLLVSYRVDPITGALREAGIVQVGRDVHSLDFSPNWHVSEAAPPRPCVIAQGYDAVEFFLFDESSGQLSVTGGGHPAGPGLTSATVHPSGRFLFVTDPNSNSIVTLSSDGARISELATQITPSVAALDPTGDVLYVGHSGANTLARYRVDPASGALHQEGAEVLTPKTGLDGLLVHPSGRLLVTSYRGSGSLFVFRIDSATGAMKLGSSAPLSRVGASSITMDATGRYLLATHAGEGALSFFVVDEPAGRLRPVESDFTARGAAIGATFVHGAAPWDWGRLLPLAAQPAATTL